MPEDLLQGCHVSCCHRNGPVSRLPWQQCWPPDVPYRAILQAHCIHHCPAEAGLCTAGTQRTRQFPRDGADCHRSAKSLAIPRMVIGRGLEPYQGGYLTSLIPGAPSFLPLMLLEPPKGTALPQSWWGLMSHLFISHPLGQEHSKRGRQPGHKSKPSGVTAQLCSRVGNRTQVPPSHPEP